MLSGLRAALPPHVLLGVGTVMDDTVSQIGLIKALGGTFARDRRNGLEPSPQVACQPCSQGS